MKMPALFLSVLLAPLLAFAGETYPDISQEDLMKAIEAKSVVVIDVNGSESYAKGRIPGAIDYEASKDKLASLLPADKNALIVAYCGGPMCKAYKKAAKAASELGYTNVKHFSKGISGWLASKAPVEKGGGS